VQLHRLKLVNFRQHAETELVLGPGLTAVIGPNGSGKTTILEAVAWALYGNPAARGSRESLRRIGAPARAPVRVEVDFTLGAHEYRVVRSLYGAELFQDGGEGPVANSHQSVSNKIVRLLGMTHDEFFSTYFTGQKELAVMASMGPSDRGKFLSRLLGYEKLRQAQDHLRQRRSTLRAKVAGLMQGLEDLDVLKGEQEEVERQLRAVKTLAGEIATELKRAQAALQEAAPVWRRITELREANLATDGERRIAEQMVQDARQAFERIDRELAEAIEAKNRLDGMQQELARAAELRVELDHLDREAQAAGKRRLLSGQLTEVSELAHTDAAHAEFAQVAPGAPATAAAPAVTSRAGVTGSLRNLLIRFPLAPVVCRRILDDVGQLPPPLRVELDDLAAALVLHEVRLFCHLHTYLLAEGKSECVEKRLAVIVIRCGRHQRDVHATHLDHLVIVDLRKNQLLRDAKAVVTASVEAADVEPAEVTDSRDGERNQSVEELPHSITAQGDRGSDRHALADLEVRHRLAGTVDPWLLTGDDPEVGNGGVDQFGVLRGVTDSHVDDDLFQARDLHHVTQPEPVPQLGNHLVVVLLLESRNHDRSTPHLRHTRYFRP